MGAGEEFDCENDGSIYAWILNENGLRRKNTVPLCSIEVLTLPIP